MQRVEPNEDAGDAGASAASTDHPMSNATVVDVPASRADPKAAREIPSATQRGRRVEPPRVAAAAAVIDQLWAAHPLSKLLPIDWGGICWALTEVSFRAIVDPGHA